MAKAVHAAFELVKTYPIETLNLVANEYIHRQTAARHFHLEANNDENIFMVALRTVPVDSTGVAHILEHTVLCGSERYPVRDPFFMMIRRSLNTFMNAFTSSDWTAYPFASQNRKDFNNLLDVYLDAVFFSRLAELDFLQEGHRLEFAEPSNIDSELVYKGVVYNEMKGAMSSPVSMLWQTLTKYLYPTTTYHFNSGGDPEQIPDLSYRQLQEFYQTHYHPSNSIFFTYGDIPAIDHQQKFHDQALKHFDALESVITVNDEKRYFAPVRIQEYYPLSEEDTSHKNHIVVGWLLGSSADLEQSLKAKLISNLLLDNSASPLLHTLETTTLGNAPSPLCGLEDSNREMCFVCGLEGAKEESAEEVEALILEVLARVAEEGVPLSQVEAVLHQLELSQREIGGDSYPYGLQLALTALPAAIHGGDVFASLDIAPAIEELRQQIQQPDFIKAALRELLLDNPHRVRLLLSPDPELAEKRIQGEKEVLAKIKNSLDVDQKQLLVSQAESLVERQTQKDDESILPKVDLADVPPNVKWLECNRDNSSPTPLTFFNQGTNGLVYQQLVIELPELDTSLLPLLPLFSSYLAELGAGDKDYLQMQNWQSEVTGGVHAYTDVRSAADTVSAYRGYFVLSGKALERNQSSLTEMMKQIFLQPRFDELQRIRELVAQSRLYREQSVTGSGHSLAMSAASSGYSPVGYYQFKHHGLHSIKTLQELDNGFSEGASLEALADKFRQIHQLLLRSPREFLLVGEEEKAVLYGDTLRRNWQETPNSHTMDTSLKLESGPGPQRQVWVTDTQVNFCAMAFPTVPMDHPDAAALTVLGGFLRNGYLHRAIRENGGAYGGGASHDTGTGSFRFYSYRDPRLLDTLDDFKASIEWVLSVDHSWQSVEEAILGVIGALDKPGSPAGEAKRTFHLALHGRNKAVQQQYRERILAVTQEDLKRVASTYLTSHQASEVVIGSEAAGNALVGNGYEKYHL